MSEVAGLTERPGGRAGSAADLGAVGALALMFVGSKKYPYTTVAVDDVSVGNHVVVVLCLLFSYFCFYGSLLFIFWVQNRAAVRHIS